MTLFSSDCCVHSSNSTHSWIFVWLTDTKSSEYLLSTYYVLGPNNCLKEVMLEMRRPKHRRVGSTAPASS